MRVSNVILSLAIFTAIFQSCNIINPAERVPTYVHIDSVQFVPIPNTGSGSQKITSAWVFFDNAPLGAFELPATVPVLTDKQGVITVRPGVVYSGLKDILTPYPFFALDTITINPSQGQVINLHPKTRYFSDTTFNFIYHDFDVSSGFSKLSGDTELVRTGDPAYVFEGGYSGLIYLNNQSTAQSLMLQPFVKGQETYFELNYKSSVAFGIGVQGQDASGNLITQVVLTVKPHDTWNKLYVGLQDFISAYPNGPYRMVITVAESSPITGYVALDNLKVISKKQ
jgi:hypothetical protein